MAFALLSSLSNPKAPEGIAPRFDTVNLGTEEPSQVPFGLEALVKLFLLSKALSGVHQLAGWLLLLRFGIRNRQNRVSGLSHGDGEIHCVFHFNDLLIVLVVG